MADTKFTPGPWVFSNGNLLRVSKSVGGSSVCICGVHRIGRLIGDEDQAVATANGRLIAASPELYEALRRLLTPEQEAHMDENPDAFHEDWHAARAAMRKARGDTAP